MASDSIPSWGASSGYEELYTNPELRLSQARIDAHELFDRLWRNKVTRHDQCVARRKAYRWLAAMMGISEDECHFKLFNEARCQEAIEICEAHFGEMHEES